MFTDWTNAAVNGNDSDQSLTSSEPNYESVVAQTSHIAYLQVFPFLKACRCNGHPEISSNEGNDYVEISNPSFPAL